MDELRFFEDVGAIFVETCLKNDQVGRIHHLHSNWRVPLQGHRWFMMASSNENIFRAGNSPVTGEFPSQRSVTRSFCVFFDLLE